MAIQFDNTNTGAVTLVAPASGTTTLQFPAALGAAGTFLTTNGSGVLSFTAGGAALTGFTSTVLTSGAFTTTNSSKLSGATTASAGVSIAIVPRGLGNLLACIPDGTTAGGNARGTECIDLQLTNQRTAANQVAADANNFIGGGYANRTTATRACIAGGSTNTVLGGVSSIMGGTNNTVTVNGSISCILGGSYNQQDNSYSTIVGGMGSASLSDYTTVYGSSNFGSTTVFGKAQTRYQCLTAQPNANANFQLNNNNVTASGLTTVTAAQGIYIAQNSAVLVRALVVQKRITPAGNRVYTGVGLWRRGTGAATNVLNTNAIYGTSGTVTAWGFSLSTNTTSNTAAPIVSSTAGVTSYVCGYMQVLDVGAP
jgi:hypothetical protein